MRLVFDSVAIIIFLFSSLACPAQRSGQKSISLEQLLGKKVTEKVEQVSGENIGAIGSVLERIELTGNILTQDKVNTPYRRYVVNGTMDLDSKTVSIPDGCILDLERGSLKNGTLKMNSTLVTPIYSISKGRNISKVTVSGKYLETLVDLWGEQAEPLFPWDTTAPKKVYDVDLRKFGITTGYQDRGRDNHYTDKQYDLMYSNGIGFTNAIRWAYENGYDGIRFPKNDYCFTPRTTRNEKPEGASPVVIQDIDKFDIDFGGGSYYLILDSKKKSKHYVLEPEKPYSQGGTIFFVAACINLQLHDGVFVGDRALRDYDDAKENGMENTRAFVISGFCQNIRLHHLEMSYFMADGISCSQSGGIKRGYDDIYQGIRRVSPGVSNLVPGDRDFTTVSGLFSIERLYSQPDAMKLDVVRKIASKRAYSINNNQGYTRLINPFHNLEVLTYGKDNSRGNPLRTIKTSYLETIMLAPGETNLKIRSAYDEGAGSDGIKHSVTVSELISSHIVIEYCVFTDNHRGGISGGANDVTIRNCVFKKNHQLKNYQGKTMPLYLFAGTNYHINFEDSFAKDLKVYNCTFSRTSSKIGKLLFGVYTLDFHHNVSDTRVVLYNNILSDIHDNVFSGEALHFASWRLTDYDDGLKKHGFKYLTRVALLHDNSIGGADSKDKVDERTLLFSFNNH